ncbi:ISL3 family transposase [Pseudovibrio sp. POLY-S9]|uniref:ISL3 family transposase n=1 Tax=Pseudovibrio sp. POLY-S9 TaxID=1576596 RepID=UPI0009E7562D|nr:ISL3 family transposase [Pseudovibrio sp. POLY-S9]
MSQINIPLDIESLDIVAQTIDDEGNFILDVVSKNDHSTCHKCGKPATKRNGKAPSRLVRHLPLLDRPVYLRITPVRYSCEHCDDHPTTTEQYDWCEHNASVTKGLEKYLMRSLIHSTVEDVAKKEQLGPKLIQAVLARQVDISVDWSTIVALETLGIDEIALKKGHRSYVTVVSAKPKSNSPIVLAVLEGRSKEDVKAFLKSIPEPLKQTVKHVCTDMYDGYINAATEVFGEQKLVVDRYHVAKLYRRPLDKLRTKEMARLKSELAPQDYDKLEGMMWILRQHNECLSQADKDKLHHLYKHSPILKQAHHYALRLTHIFNSHSSRKSALAKINRWIKAVGKSGLRNFDCFIKTLVKNKGYIANYFKGRKTSGFVEGLNNKIKVVKRRCYGLFNTQTIFQRLFLDLQGYEKYV